MVKTCGPAGSGRGPLAVLLVPQDRNVRAVGRCDGPGAVKALLEIWNAVGRERTLSRVSAAADGGEAPEGGGGHRRCSGRTAGA